MIAIPYGSFEKRGPTTFVWGSCAWKLSRIASSLVTASTMPRWSATRQSVRCATGYGIASGFAVLRFSIEVEPTVAHTFLPARSRMPVIAELDGTSRRWPTS